MRKFSYVVFFSVFGVCALAFFTYAETISTFDAHIVVHENATIEVTEQIVYDFGNAEDRHGIYRNIPFSYQARSETYTAEVSSVFVTDEEGNPRPFQESRGNGELTLKIGDPNVTITGKHVYVISYLVHGPFLYFEEFDELFWNVTGFWERPIQSANVIVDLPRGVTVLQAACYKGKDGEGTACDEDERLVSAERAGYRARATNLGNEEGFTIAVAFPKGVIAEIEQPWKRNTLPKIFTYVPFLLPIVVFFYMAHLWYRRGRDPKGRSAIVTEFEPPEDITPSVAGFVTDEMVNAEAITAEIVRLAVLGYIKIHRYEDRVLLFNKKDFLLERTGDELPQDEVLKTLLEKLFQSSFEESIEINGENITGVTLTKMKNKFVDEKKDIAKVIREEGMKRNLFREDPKRVRMRYTIAGIGGIFLGVALAVLLEATTFGVFLGVSVGISGAITLLFAFLMPVKTLEGVHIKQHLKGFERYLKLAEKERIAFHDSPEREANEPEKTMDIFNSFLPYAMVFGVEEQWAEKFENIFTEEPHWYHNSTGGSFSMGALSGGLSDFSKSVSTASAPRSSGSGGGGSVGGGFGGGGGGSW